MRLPWGNGANPADGGPARRSAEGRSGGALHALRAGPTLPIRRAVSQPRSTPRGLPRAAGARQSNGAGIWHTWSLPLTVVAGNGATPAAGHGLEVLYLFAVFASDQVADVDHAAVAVAGDTPLEAGVVGLDGVVVVGGWVRGRCARLGA